MSRAEKLKSIERPILFSDEMVRAILDGRKTQTRRVVKNREILDSLNEVGVWDGPGEVEDWERSMCPYGQPGDRLWVREAWKPVAVYDPGPAPFHPDPPSDWGAETYDWDGPIPLTPQRNCGVFFRATGDEDGPWRSPIHMPRWASRITLKITDVRVQRLQDIDEGAARREGFRDVGLPRQQLASYWNYLNEKREASWDSNPWVWVIHFQRVEQGP